MISSLSSAIEHSDPTQTLHPQVIQEYLVCLPQLQQEESKVFLHSAMIEALDKMKNRAKAERNAACAHVAYRKSHHGLSGIH